MTLFVENETDYQFPFDIEEIATMVVDDVLDAENCPYEVTLSLSITDSESIKQINEEYRNNPNPTDVLSFPNIDYESPADFNNVEGDYSDCFDPDTGELMLGDIVINYERVISQSQDYGHSLLREFAFLCAHSMYHLLGYDHMTEDEAVQMEMKQEETLQRLNITRD